MAEEVKDQQEQASQVPPMADVLSKLPDAPPQSQIDQWKNQFGDVFVSGFSETEIYVWRALNRLEYRQLQSQLVDPEAKMDELRYQEQICERCVLWPKPDPQYWSICKAGTASTLAEQIMMQSNFVAPHIAAQLVAKL